MRDDLPPAITMGDPAGIGPEIVIKALAARPGRRHLVIGDAGVLRRAARAVGAEVEVRIVRSAQQVVDQAAVVDVLPATHLPDDVAFGRLEARCGRAAYTYVERACALALAGEVSAVVTAPINKEALHLAGVPFPGHTEMLAHFAGVERFAMMLATPQLRVVLVSAHVALRDALAMLSVDLELTTIRLAAGAARRLGVEQPRVAVQAVLAGVRVEAGNGDEEQTTIAPAVRLARDEGIDASGPWPPDTVFMRARAGAFDVVVCQYHDQGLIPIKYLGLDEGVNVTLGLPFVRTSVDHGTAFDIAGTGRADASSLLVALEQADQLTRRPTSARPEDPAHV
jgi:4-hydroxythreonine-4-phosphate dehydrogenase